MGQFPMFQLYMQFGIKTNHSVWSKITLITSSVGEAGVDPPSCKTGTFFLRSLALNVPIYRNFQSNLSGHSYKLVH